MSYSNLVSYVKLSPNCTKRTHPIEGITVHHMAGNGTLAGVGNVFAQPSRKASANYGIDSEGRIACYVEEEYRAWTSGNRENDDRCITIEVANCSGDPDWKVSDKAYAALLDLCEDICRRYGFNLNYTGDTGGNLTMHKWFEPTVCPGPYLESKFPEIAKTVNARLTAAQTPAETAGTFYRVQVGAFKVKDYADNLRDKLQALGYKDAFIAAEGGVHRVQIGAFTDKTNADNLCRKIKSLGMDAFVLTVSRSAAPQLAAKPAIEEGSTVRVNKGAKACDGTALAPFVYERDHVVDSITGDRVVITYGGVVVAAVKLSDLTPV